MCNYSERMAEQMWGLWLRLDQETPSSPGVPGWLVLALLRRHLCSTCEQSSTPPATFPVTLPGHPLQPFPQVDQVHEKPLVKLFSPATSSWTLRRSWTGLSLICYAWMSSDPDAASFNDVTTAPTWSPAQRTAKLLAGFYYFFHCLKNQTLGSYLRAIGGYLHSSLRGCKVIESDWCRLNSYSSYCEWSSVFMKSEYLSVRWVYQCT